MSHARITLVLTPQGHIRSIFCDRRASVVTLGMVDIARAGGDVAFNAPEGSKALDETGIPVGQQMRVRREHERTLPRPKAKANPGVPELTVSLTGKSAEGFVKQCEAEGINAHERLRLIAATWRSHRQRKAE